MGIHCLRYSLGEPVLDSPFPIFCRPLALGVQFWETAEPPDCSQTEASKNLIFVVEVAMAMTCFVPSACNDVMVCHWAECSLEGVGGGVGLLGLGAGVGR